MSTANQRLAWLEHPDAAVREYAIRAVARTADPRAIKPLKMIADRDPVPSLRILARKAVEHIQGHAELAADMETQVDAFLAVKSDTIGNRILHRVPTFPIERYFSHRHMMAGLVVLVGSLLLLFVGHFFVSSGLYDRYMTVMGMEQVEYDIQHLRTPTGVEYYLLVPGEAPPEGWRVLVAIHGSGGNGLAMMGLFADRCRREGILLIAPTFISEVDNSEIYFYHPNDAHLNDILDRVSRAHPFDERGVVMVGYSIGAIFTSIYATDYTSDMAGVGLIAMPPQGMAMPLPSNRNLQYWIMAGENDDFTANASQDYANELWANGNPVLLELIPGVGQTISSEHIELTMELINDAYDS